MLANQQQSHLDSITTENEAFNQSISSYEPIENESEQLVPPAIEEEDTSVEILTEEFITKSGLDSAQLNLNMALCREFEGE